MLTVDQTKRFEDIQTLAQQMIQRDMARDLVFIDLENMYLTIDPKAPSGTNDFTTLSAKPHNAVSQIQDILCTSAPQVEVPEIAETPAEEHKADRVREALQAVLYRAEENNDDLQAQLVGQCAIFGTCALKVLDKRRMWRFRGMRQPEIDRKMEEGAFPFLFTALHPRTIHVLRVDDEVEAVVQEGFYKVAEVRRMFGHKATELSSLDLNAEVCLREYWDKEFQCIWLASGGQASTLIGPIAHKGIIPYFIHNVRSARYLGLADREGQSMLRPLLDSKAWQRQNLVLTVISNNAHQLINKVMITKTEGRVGIPIKADTPGAQIDLAPNESVEPMQVGDIAPVVRTFSTMLESEIDLSLISRVVSGSAPGGVTAGYAINILSQGARTKISSIQKATERCIAGALQGVMRYVELNGQAKIWGPKVPITLKPEEVKGYYNVQVTMVAKLPQDKQADAQVAQVLKGTGIVSDEFIAEEILEVPYTREQDRLVIQNINKVVDPIKSIRLAREKGWIEDDEQEEYAREKLGIKPREQEEPETDGSMIDLPGVPEGQQGMLPPNTGGMPMPNVGMPPPVPGEGGNALPMPPEALMSLMQGSRGPVQTGGLG